MRYFRRMPPLLRVASILGVLFPLASMILLVPLLIRGLSTISQLMDRSTSTQVPQLPVDFFRMLVIGQNLSILGLACVFIISAYSMRFRRRDGGPFLLDSWQSQVRAIALLAALPLCAIILALVTTQTLPLTFVFIPLACAISVFAVLVILVASFWVLVTHVTYVRQAVGR